jgi:hypothetical protein
VIPETSDPSSITRSDHMSKDSATTARSALSIVVKTTIIRNKPLKEYYNSVKNS